MTPVDLLFAIFIGALPVLGSVFAFLALLAFVTRVTRLV